MTTTPAAVTARGLGKRYPGGAWALQDVALELAPGSSLAVVGENGSGKSTLLDLLLGATRPSAGELRVAQPLAALLELGAGFFLELSGRENGVQAALLAGTTPRAARELAAEAGAFAELGDWLDRPVRTYSAGMVMRLGFALAVALPAAVTLVDEVLAVGDGYFQRKCIDRLRQLRGEGRTLVVASHDLHALRGLCEQALWLRHGRVEAQGPAGAVLDRYQEHLRLRAAEGGAPKGRRGTGQVAIRRVRLMDDTGQERAQFSTGQTLRVEVDFDALEPLESPVMGVALFREDGIYCYGPNTGFDGCLGGTYQGSYRLTAEFPDLPLLAGGYEVSVAFYDKDHVYAYAWDHRLYPFRVSGDRPDHGVVLLRHRFSVSKLA